MLQLQSLLVQLGSAVVTWAATNVCMCACLHVCRPLCVAVPLSLFLCGYHDAPYLLCCLAVLLLLVPLPLDPTHADLGVVVDTVGKMKSVAFSRYNFGASEANLKSTRKI